MIIDFENTELQTLHNFKGGEGDTLAKMFADGNNRIMFGKLGPGASIGLHRHEGSSEIIFIQQGFGKVLFEDAYEKVKAGDVHYCPCGCRHSLINDSEDELTYFAVVPQHEIVKQKKL